MPNINIIKFLKPNLRLVRGTRLTSGLFIGASIAVAAGILFAANMYYNIDTSTVMVEERQQVTGHLYATTTVITGATSTGAALTVTQTVSSGYGAVITGGNVGVGTTTPGALFTVGTSTSVLIVNKEGKVGVATTTPSDTFAVQGNIMGSGNVTFYGATATTTIIGGLVVDTDTLYVAASANRVGIATSTPSDTLAVGGNIMSSGKLTVYSTATSTFEGPIADASGDLILAGGGANRYLLLNPYGGNVGVATTTPSDTFAIQGNIMSSGNITFYGANSTTTIAGGLVVDTNTLYVAASANRVGIATSTPSDTLAVQGNIIGSGNIIVYASATSTFGGGIRTGGDIAATGGALSIYLTSAGALSLHPQSNSDVIITLGGTGQLKIGSSGQFYIDASGNATTSGTIYADAFISTGTGAYTRRSGEEIVRGVVPIFGFDLPARCNTSCNSGSATATISRVVENADDIFPNPYPGTTRKFRFSIRYADATTTAATRTTWDVATSSDPSYKSRFTLPPTSSTDLAKGFTTTTNQVTLPTTTGDATDDWFLRVSTGGSGNYDLQVYEILLIGLDEVN